MKKLIKTISTVFFALAMVLSSCEKDPSGKEPGGAKAAKINIEIQKYYNELGTMSLKNWEAGDKVAAFNADNADPVLGYGSPITTGAQTSLFTIAVTSVANGDDIMAYYPSSADVTPVSGGLKAKIASLQNGTLPSSVFVGNTKFNDSYSGSRMTLKPFWCVLYANVQMGAYSIKKAEIVANAGEKIAGDIDIKAEDLSVTASASSVTVEYAEARDCRLGGITIPIAVAPVALSKGYTITFTTENGETFQYKNEEVIHIHTQVLGVVAVEGVLCIDEGGNTTGLLCLGNGVDSQRGLTRRLGAEDLDDTSLRVTTHTKSHIKRYRTGRDDRNVVHFVAVHAHNRAFAKVFLDLGHHRVQDLKLVGVYLRFLCHNLSCFIFFSILFS